MDALGAWLDRLQTGTEAGADDEPALSFVVRQRRLVVPGFEPPQGENHILRLIPIGRVGERGEYPGKLPQSVSLVEWPDTVPGATPSDIAVGEVIAAVLTFVSNRRVEVASGEVPLSFEESLIFLASSDQAPDRTLYGPFPSGDILSQFDREVTRIASLPTSDRAAVVSALRLHHGACALMETDLAAAYTLLVAAVEALASQFDDFEVSWDSFEHHERFDQVFSDQGLSSTQAEVLRAELLAERHLRLRQRFASYGASVPSELWKMRIETTIPSISLEKDGARYTPNGGKGEQVAVDKLLPPDRDGLRRALLRTYDVRSGFVHAGESDIELSSELVTLARGYRIGSPLPFLALRMIVMSLVRKELDERAQEFSLPRVSLISRPARDTGRAD
jgi:hypothetical protein